MKKTYNSPKAIITHINGCHHLLAGSTKGTSVYGANADSKYETLSRKSNFSWDDDDEDF